MPRKPHTKSRNGCASCKKRHIKCDELQPRCAACSISRLECHYPSPPPAVTRSAGWKPLSNGRSSQVRTDVTGPRRFLAADARDCTFPELELLYNFSFETYRTLSPLPTQQNVWRQIAVQLGLTYPFLMHQILAISSLHLAQSRPGRRHYYTNKATELQTLAMRGFNEIQTDVDAASCKAVFLFSALLAIHLLADLAHTEHLASGVYLDRLLGCLRLVNGAREVTLATWDDELRNSDLGPIFENCTQSDPLDIPGEVRDLSKIIAEADLSASSVKAYQEPIERLQRHCAMTNTIRENLASTHWILAWPMRLRADFLDALGRRRPEALVILAYFGAILHPYRESWIIGGTGASIFDAVKAQTGSYWQQWLDWPTRIVHPTMITPETRPTYLVGRGHIGSIVV